MIIDANIFIGESLLRNSVSEDALEAMMRENKLDKAVIRPLKPVDHDYDKANRYVARVQEKNPQIAAFGRVNPWEVKAPEQVKKAIREYGLKGIHLHPWEENFCINSEVVNDVMEVIAEMGVPVYINAGYPIVSEPLQILELMERYPQVTAITTHACQLDISGLSFDDALIVAEAKNIKFDISGVYRRDFIELLVNKAGADNVLFGSCAPYMDVSLEIERIKAVQISDDIKEKIFYKNIMKLVF
jgi:predicted TIM-barrel fold metal-dependent hydrolase